jgi:ribonuclease HIII
VKVPVWVNLKEKELPTGRLPLSKTLESDVTVWVVLSLFVQVTVVPTLICRLDGWNDRLTIETAAVEDVAVTVGVDVAGTGVFVGALVGALVEVAEELANAKVDMMVLKIADSAALSNCGGGVG